METEQGCSCRHISAQPAIEFLVAIWLELLDWGAVALNSAGRFLTALLNCIMLAITATIAVFAVLVLILRDKITNPPEASTFSLISIKTFMKRTRTSISDS